MESTVTEALKDGQGGRVSPWVALFSLGLPDSTQDSHQFQSTAWPSIPANLPQSILTLLRYAVTKRKLEGFWTTILLHISFPYGKSFYMGTHPLVFRANSPQGMKFLTRGSSTPASWKATKIGQWGYSLWSQPAWIWLSALQLNSFRIFGKSLNLPVLLSSQRAEWQK